MTPGLGRDWNEAHLSEDPAVDLLERMGYTTSSQRRSKLSVSRSRKLH